jgi:hypothetical protein
MITFGLIILLFSIGCSDDDQGGGGGATTHHLSVTFQNYFGQSSGPAVVVVDNAAGDTVLSVLSIDYNGVVDFGDIGRERVTVTIKTTNSEHGYPWTSIRSYRNAPVGYWNVIGSPPLTQDSLGFAYVTLNFPHVDNGRMTLGLPGGQSMYSGRIENDTVYGAMSRIHALDSGRMTILASLKDSIFQYFGWVADQPFQIGGDNGYTIHLTDAVEHRVVTASRPLNELQVYAMRGSHDDMYRVFYDGGITDRTTFDVPLPDFPASKWWVSGEHSDWMSSEFRKGNFASYIADQVAPNLEIPEGEIICTFNPETHGYENVAFTGNADYIIGSWHGQNVTWVVYKPVDQAPIEPPVVPDSVCNFTAIPDIWPDGIVAFDYNTITGYDGFVALEMAFGDPWPQSYTSYAGYAYDNPGALKMPGDVHDPAYRNLHRPSRLK